jgi:phage/plasmid-associated DNA primase
MVSMVARVTATQTKPAPLRLILDQIREGRWQREVQDVRALFAARGKDAADTRKKDLPAFMPAGLFSQRKTEALQEAVGILCLDFDGLYDRLPAVRAKVEACPHTLAAFVSPKGNGLKVLVRVPAEPTRYADYWRVASDHYREACGAEADPSRKDLAGLCLVSDDPALFINEAAVPFEAGGEQKPKKRPLSDFLPTPGIPPSVQQWIEQGVPEGAGPHGGRNATAFQIACQLRDEGHDQATVDKHVQEFAARCQPPLDHEDARRTVDSAFTRPPREPARGLPKSEQQDTAHEGPAGDEQEMPDPSEDQPESGTGGLAEWNDPQLVNRYGRPYFEKVDKGQLKFSSLNEIYWAALHKRDNIELFEPAEKAFYRYDEKTGLFLDLSADLIRQEVADYLLVAGNKKRALAEERTDSRLRNIVSHLRGLTEHRNAFAKGERHFVHLANGVLEIGADGIFMLKPFSPDYLSRNQSPLIFQPDAKCPRFLNELLLPAVTAEDAILIQKYAGLCLLGHNLIQRFLILDGEAGRGKTQLALIIQLLVGLTNCTQLRTAHLGERFETFRFLKKTLLVGVDVQADFLNTPGASVIKGLVGGDLFDAEQKGGTGCFQIAGNFNILITSNARLRVRLEGDLGAWRRRLNITRFEAPPPKKKIPDFGRRLVEEEGSGILNWALDGLRALLKDIAEIGDIYMSPAQSGVVDALLAESDSLRHFLKHTVERRPGSDLTATEVIEAYAEYCPEQGWSPLPITVVQRQLESLMLELFGTVKVNSISRQDRSQKGFRSVGWKGAEPEPRPAQPVQEPLL